jgi:hypothetical protein
MRSLFKHFKSAPLSRVDTTVKDTVRARVECLVKKWLERHSLVTGSLSPAKGRQFGFDYYNEHHRSILWFGAIAASIEITMIQADTQVASKAVDDFRGCLSDLQQSKRTDFLSELWRLLDLGNLREGVCAYDPYVVPHPCTTLRKEIIEIIKKHVIDAMTDPDTYKANHMPELVKPSSREHFQRSLNSLFSLISRSTPSTAIDVPTLTLSSDRSQRTSANGISTFAQPSYTSDGTQSVQASAAPFSPTNNLGLAI